VGMGGVQVDERPTAVVGQRFGVGFQAAVSASKNAPASLSRMPRRSR
jgi:hypothetical protein